MRLNPGKRELRALLDNFVKRTDELEMPTTWSCDALHGLDRTLTHPGHDETPNDSPLRLPLTILTVVTRQV
jgi:hypothetical protein